MRRTTRPARPARMQLTGPAKGQRGDPVRAGKATVRERMLAHEGRCGVDRRRRLQELLRVSQEQHPAREHDAVLHRVADGPVRGRTTATAISWWGSAQGAAHALTCSTRYKDQALTTSVAPFRFLAGSHFTDDACCDLCGDFKGDGCQLWSLNATGCALYWKVPLDRKAAAGTTVGTLDTSPPGPPHCPVPGKSPGSFCDLKATPDACPSSCPCAPCLLSDPACGCKS